MEFQKYDVFVPVECVCHKNTLFIKSTDYGFTGKV